MSEAGKRERNKEKKQVLRLSKLTDYGMLVMSCFARGPVESLRTARGLAEESRLPLPTVSKLLKELLRGGLVVSERGLRGGYRLARDPREISLADIIHALEGPVALTECSADVSGLCELETCCAIKNNQRVISDAVREVLQRLTLAQLTQPLRAITPGNVVSSIQAAERIQ